MPLTPTEATIVTFEVMIGHYWRPVAARGEIGREGYGISSLVEHMGLSPWLFL